MGTPAEKLKTRVKPAAELFHLEAAVHRRVATGEEIPTELIDRLRKTHKAAGLPAPPIIEQAEEWERRAASVKAENRDRERAFAAFASWQNKRWCEKEKHGPGSEIATPEFARAYPLGALRKKRFGREAWVKDCQFEGFTSHEGLAFMGPSWSVSEDDPKTIGWDESQNRDVNPFIMVAASGDPVQMTGRFSTEIPIDEGWWHLRAHSYLYMMNGWGFSGCPVGSGFVGMESEFHAEAKHRVVIDPLFVFPNFGAGVDQKTLFSGTQKWTDVGYVSSLWGWGPFEDDDPETGQDWGTDIEINALVGGMGTLGGTDTLRIYESVTYKLQIPSGQNFDGPVGYADLFGWFGPLHYSLSPVSSPPGGGGF